MRLFAAIVPPRAVLDELIKVLQSVDAPAEPAIPRRGLLGRRSAGGTHAARQTETSAAHEGELDRPTAAEMYLPITHFGNVTLGDSVQLADALRADVATWSRPEVHFSGGAALEWPGDESVWAKLDGDVDALMTIGRGVPLVVQRLGFFVDRRQFRPWLSVGTITAATTAPYLEQLVGALETFRGQDWTVESVSLMKRLPEAEGPVDFEEMERMPLAAD
jgi:RNA 2',3'-cyclic 3'-phosphodiesterase